MPTRVGITGYAAEQRPVPQRSARSATAARVFNFNPYNWYQTPQEKWGGVALANFEINEHAEVYGKLIFSSTEVNQQIAPSGIFSQPYLDPACQPVHRRPGSQALIDFGNAGRVAGDSGRHWHRSARAATGATSTTTASSTRRTTCC